MQHFYCPCLVCTSYLLPIYSQNTISHAYVQSVHHLSCPCPISTPSLLPITSENPTLPAHVLSIHISFHCTCPVRMPPKALCPCPVRILSFLSLYACTVSTPPFLLMSNQSRYIPPISSQVITPSTHIQLQYDLSYSRLVDPPYLLPSSSQNTSCPIHV